MKTIYFVRHGETEANVARIIAGGEYESPLTDNGKMQAKQAGRELKGKKIDAIVSSPMERTRDTAIIIAKEIGYNPKKIIYDKAFVEVFNGFYSGKPYALRDRHIVAGELIEDIESPNEVYDRVNKGFERIRKMSANSIVLVSHGATGCMIRAILNKIPHHDFMSHEKFGNAEIYEFTLE